MSKKEDLMININARGINSELHINIIKAHVAFHVASTLKKL